MLSKNLIVLISSFLFTASVYASNTIIVNCTNIQPPSVSPDRQMIQNAIDNASTGDVIKIIGICQLDGNEIIVNKSDITLDGAGSAGSWSTVLQGITSGGAPAKDKGAPTFNFYNRGIRIGPANTNISNVTIKNLKFHSLRFAVSIYPQFHGSSNRCDWVDIQDTSSSNIVVQNNWFDNNFWGVVVIGMSDNLTIQDNLLTNAVAGDFSIQGQAFQCKQPTNSGTFINSIASINNPSIILIDSNTAASINANHESIGLFSTNNDTISNNTILFNSIYSAIGLDNVQDIKILNNTIEGFGLATGIYMSDIFGIPFGWIGNSSNVLIKKNQINNTVPGIFIDSGTTGSYSINNNFIGSGVADIFLCDNKASTFFCSGGIQNSFYNKVVTNNFSNVVIDLGINNKIVGTQNLLNNPNVSIDVKTKLIDGKIGAPQLDNS